MEHRPSFLEQIDTDTEQQPGFGSIELQELRKAIESGQLDQQEQLDQLEQELLLPQYQLLSTTFIQQLAYEKHAITYNTSTLKPKDQENVMRLRQIVDRQFDRFAFDQSLELSLLDQQTELQLIERLVNQKFDQLKKLLNNHQLIDKIWARIQDAILSGPNATLQLKSQEQQLLGKYAQKIFDELFVAYENMPGLLTKMHEVTEGITALIETQEGTKRTQDNQLRKNYYQYMGLTLQQDFIEYLVSTYSPEQIRLMDQTLVQRIDKFAQLAESSDPLYPLLIGVAEQGAESTQYRVSAYNESRKNSTETLLWSQHLNGGIIDIRLATQDDRNRLVPQDPIRTLDANSKSEEFGPEEQAMLDKQEQLKSIVYCYVGKTGPYLINTAQIRQSLAQPLQPGEYLCLRETVSDPIKTDPNGVLYPTSQHLVVTHTQDNQLLWETDKNNGNPTYHSGQINAQEFSNAQQLEELSIAQFREHPAMHAFMHTGMVLNENLLPLANLVDGQVTPEMIPVIQEQVHAFMSKSRLDIQRSALDMQHHLQQLEQIDFVTLDHPAAEEMRLYIQQMRTMCQLILPTAGRPYTSSPLYQIVENLREVRANTLLDWFRKDGLPLIGAILVAVGASIASGGTAAPAFIGGLARHTLGRAAIMTIAGSIGYRTTRRATGLTDERFKIKTDVEKFIEGSLTREQFSQQFALEILLGTATMGTFLKSGQILGKRIQLNPQTKLAQYITKYHSNFRQLMSPELARANQSFLRQWVRESGFELAEESAEAVATQINPLLGSVVTMYNCLSPGSRPLRINAVQGNIIDVSILGVNPTEEQISTLIDKQFIQVNDTTFALEIGEQKLILHLDTQLNTDQDTITDNLLSIETKPQSIEQLNLSIDQLITMIDQVQGDKTLEQYLSRSVGRLGQSTILGNISSTVTTKWNQLVQLINDKITYFHNNYEIVSLMTGSPFRATANMGLLNFPILKKKVFRGQFENLASINSYEQLTTAFPKGYHGVDLQPVTQEEFNQGLELIYDQLSKGARIEYLTFLAITQLKITNQQVIKKLITLAQQHKTEITKNIDGSARKNLEQHNRKTARVSGQNRINIEIPVQKYGEKLLKLKITTDQISKMDDKQLYEHLKKILDVFEGDPDQFELFQSVCMGSACGPLYKVRNSNTMYGIRRWWIQDVTMSFKNWKQHTKMVRLGLTIGLTQVTDFWINYATDTIKSLPEPINDALRSINTLTGTVSQKLEDVQTFSELGTTNPLGGYNDQLQDLSQLYDQSGALGKIINFFSGGKLAQADNRIDQIAEVAQAQQETIEQIGSKVQNYRDSLSQLQQLSGEYDTIAQFTLQEIENMRVRVENFNPAIVDYLSMGLNGIALGSIAYSLIQIKRIDQHKFKDINPEVANKHFKAALGISLSLITLVYLVKQRYLNERAEQTQQKIFEYIDETTQQIRTFTKQLQEN